MPNKEVVQKCLLNEVPSVKAMSQGYEAGRLCLQERPPRPPPHTHPQGSQHAVSSSRLTCHLNFSELSFLLLATNRLVIFGKYFSSYNKMRPKE